MTLWVFGYGSLMWRPGFRYEQVVRARLAGFSRRFCIYSVHHRGCETRPGLVLGLDQGGFCEGLAFRVSERDTDEAIAYLRAREQVNGVYREAHVMIDVDAAASQGGSQGAGGVRALSHSWQHVPALAYLVERAHPSYAARLPLALQARFIRGARGRSGNNLDYLVNTLAHLRELGIREREMERLAVVSGVGLRVQSAMDDERDLASEACPRLMGVTRAAALRPLSFRTLRPLERRRFGYRRLLG